MMLRLATFPQPHLGCFYLSFSLQIFSNLQRAKQPCREPPDSRPCHQAIRLMVMVPLRHFHQSLLHLVTLLVMQCRNQLAQTMTCTILVAPTEEKQEERRGTIER